MRLDHYRSLNCHLAETAKAHLYRGTLVHLLICSQEYILVFSKESTCITQYFFHITHPLFFTKLGLQPFHQTFDETAVSFISLICVKTNFFLLFLSVFCQLLHFWNRASGSPGWPQTCYITSCLRLSSVGVTNLYYYAHFCFRRVNQ